nr:serine/threonine protein kinase [Streptomyces spiramyceticus]
MPGAPGLLVAGRYRLGETIGQGGMGRVWRAFDEILDRRVAVKEMRMDGLDAEDSRIRRERTLREARATARIDHPNVVRVYDVAEVNDRLWIVMELVDSRSLEQTLAEEGPLRPQEAARIGLGLVAALREVHAVGVLHRDIKPGNVLLGRADRPGRAGRVVLTDFGIAAIQDTKALTMAGMLVGSPDYMAPERVGGRPQGPPSDLWSLGATLCAAVAGHSPFARPTTLATLHAVLYEEPVLPPEAGQLSPVLAALLAKDPALRPDLNALHAALEAVESAEAMTSPADAPGRGGAEPPEGPLRGVAEAPERLPRGVAEAPETPRGVVEPLHSPPRGLAELPGGLPHGVAETPQAPPRGVAEFPEIPPPGLAELPEGLPHGVAETPQAPPRGVAGVPESPLRRPSETLETSRRGLAEAPEVPSRGLAVTPESLPRGLAELPGGLPHGVAETPQAPPRGVAEVPEIPPPGLAELPGGPPRGLVEPLDSPPPGLVEPPEPPSRRPAEPLGRHPLARPPAVGPPPPQAPDALGAEGRDGNPVAAGCGPLGGGGGVPSWGRAAQPAGVSAAGPAAGRPVPGADSGRTPAGSRNAAEATATPASPAVPRPPRFRKPTSHALVAAVLAAAAVVATVMVLTARDPVGEPVGTTTRTPTPASTSAPTVAGTSRPPTAPPGTRSETGFAWAPPKAWTRSAKTPSNVHYHSPAGQQEIAASYALVRGGDLLAQWQQFERDSQDVPGYSKLRLERTTFQQRPAIVWEYLFTQGGEPWRARQLGFNAGGKSYQLNIWYAAGTRTEALRIYDTVAESFTPL